MIRVQKAGPCFDLDLKGGRPIAKRNRIDGLFGLALRASKVAAVANAIDPAGRPQALPTLFLCFARATS
ncbi:MAG: hypothetical protein SCG73_02520 [Nitrospiraceae bacterium]|nr:hypothetical protein [Nitrospiraceae bacterium]